MESGTYAIASTISLNLNRTVWLFILLSFKTLYVSGDHSPESIKDYFMCCNGRGENCFIPQRYPNVTDHETIAISSKILLTIK
jgi:hypothetical protein